MVIVRVGVGRSWLGLELEVVLGFNRVMVCVRVSVLLVIGLGLRSLLGLGLGC